MGVDYDGNYGIGYKIQASGDVTADELEDGIAEFIYGKLAEGSSHFQVGDGCYSGEEDEQYIVVDDAFEGGLDLAEKKALLDVELKRLRLVPIGYFGCVGGLYVW